MEFFITYCDIFRGGNDINTLVKVNYNVEDSLAIKHSRILEAIVENHREKYHEGIQSAHILIKSLTLL